MTKSVPAPLLVGVEPNPGPPTTRHLTEKQRWRIVILSEELQLTYAEIARRVNTSRFTVRSVLQRYHDTGSIKDRPGRGRKRKVSDSDSEVMLREATLDQPANPTREGPYQRQSES